jgi:hypothetical protein
MKMKKRRKNDFAKNNSSEKTDQHLKFSLKKLVECHTPNFWLMSVLGK